MPGFREIPVNSSRVNARTMLAQKFYKNLYCIYNRAHFAHKYIYRCNIGSKNMLY